MLLVLSFIALSCLVAACLPPLSMPKRGFYKKLRPGASKASRARHRGALLRAARSLGGGGDWAITQADNNRIVVERVTAAGFPSRLLDEQLGQEYG